MILDNKWPEAVFFGSKNGNKVDKLIQTASAAQPTCFKDNDRALGPKV